MNCPECDGRTGVSDTRHKDYGNYRIRKCNNCGYIFSTVEIIRKNYNELLNKKNKLEKVLDILKSVVVERKED